MTARAVGEVGIPQVKSFTGLGTHPRGMGLINTPYTIFKMRGYNTASLAFEHWQTTNPNAGPPSGHVLQNTVIAAIITRSEGLI